LKMAPLIDAFRFWQQVWFEAPRHIPVFDGEHGASVARESLDALNARFGVLRQYREFSSDYVASRNVDVWLPPEYEQASSRRFPVIYMHDGQNLFHPQSSFIGVDWAIDEAMGDLLAVNRVPAAIVVGVWNTPLRSQEYMPQRALEMFPAQLARRKTPLSDRYLKFMLGELKPFIDEHYRTLADRENTFTMGSSMGGLISIYALCEYPDQFAGAGCISTHWPAADGIVMGYLAQALPRAGKHKLYFDHGTATTDALYEPYQREVDQVLAVKGYTQGVDWVTLKFEGAEHSERAWRQRVHIPLEFLLQSKHAGTRVNST
jgi:predicted alpha/beta superfamily hydrolase